MNNDNIVIESPVKGQWAIFNPPGHPKLAYDFLAVNDKKSPYVKGGIFRHLLSFMCVTNTYAWSMPVFSPVEGEVVECWDSSPDRMSISMIYDMFKLLMNKPKVSDGFSAFGGNYILIKNKDIFVLLCHFKMDSLKVKVGDNLEVGSEIGSVGNSGSSIQPHLHVQIMGTENIFPLFENLLPFRLRQARKKMGGDIVDVKDFTLENGSQYIFN